MKPLIQKLVEIASPSGHETRIRELIRSEIEPYVDEVRVDAMGSLIARKGQASQEGADKGLKIMLAAHMDEIGIMITHVDERGFLRFLPIGGVRPHTCVGGRVRFLNGQAGVISMERQEDPAKLPSFEQLFIDTGASQREEVAQRVGDVAVFDRPFADLGNRLVAKAMDDRISVAILIETLCQMARQDIHSPHELFFVFSVQEEVGVRGATTAAFGVNMGPGDFIYLGPKEYSSDQTALGGLFFSLTLLSFQKPILRFGKLPLQLPLPE